MSLLTSGQRQFAGVLARETGLDPKVIGSWLLAEESSSAAAHYQANGYHNWLNIARTGSGDASGAHSSVWGNPITAAKATAQWLKGEGQIAHEYGKPVAGIMHILSTAGKGAQAQIGAIAGSGWAESGYNGGSSLRSLYHELGGERLSAAPGAPGAAQGGSAGFTPLGVAGATGGSGEQTQALLSQILGQLQQPQQGPRPIGHAQRPEAAEAAAPILAAGARTPGSVQPVQRQDNSLQTLVQAAMASAAQGGGEEAHVTGGEPIEGGGGGGGGGASGGNVTSLKGVVNFGGHKVAAWIAPILHYIQAHGVTPEINSGFRTYGEQKAIWDSGVRPAAEPGKSNHEGDVFPRGAVDIRNAQAVARILERSPYRGVLVYAGAKDPVHFSHPHGGGY